jgi:hypothetical protein
MKLFGSTYQIKYVNSQDKVHPDGERCDGTLWYYENRIRLYKARGLHPDKLLVAYLHEMVHIIDFDMGTELSEEQISLLALGLQSWALENGIKVKIK